MNSTSTPSPGWRPSPALRVWLALVLLLPCGCQHTTSSAPKVVRSVDGETSLTGTNIAEFWTLYDSAMKSGDFDKARTIRDRMIFRVRVDIDGWYAALEQALHEDRASFNTWTDFLELGLAGAGALASQVDAKTRFATVLGVSKGTRISYDKNWYREKATEALINAMRAGRNQQLALIITKTAQNADRYTFEEAWGDLIAYHEAGTLQGALIILAATTGTAATRSEQDVAQANKARYTQINDEMTPAMVQENQEARAIAAKMNLEQWRKTLAAIDGKEPSATTEAEVKKLIQAKLDLLFQKQTANERKKILDAFKANAPAP